MAKLKYLDRSIGQLAPYYALCFSEEEFQDELRKLKWPNRQLVDFGASADNMRTHRFSRDCWGFDVCLVCMDAEAVVKARHTGIAIAGLFVHEAMHVWRIHRDLIGEKDPSAEYEAYSVQWVSQQLMWAYEDWLKRRNPLWSSS